MWCSFLLVLHLRQRCSNGIYFRTKCVDDNECLRTPCLNGGTCVNNVGSYKCSCTGGFVGTNCENDVDECVKSKPCKNAAVCTNNKGSVVVVYYALLYTYRIISLNYPWNIIHISRLRKNQSINQLEWALKTTDQPERVSKRTREDIGVFGKTLK